jgi:hypothetical protein
MTRKTDDGKSLIVSIASREILADVRGTRTSDSSIDRVLA